MEVLATARPDRAPRGSSGPDGAPSPARRQAVRGAQPPGPSAERLPADAHPGRVRRRIAPSTSVRSTTAPLARQRSTTSGAGRPKRLPRPSEKSASQAWLAGPAPGVLDVREPWCGTFTTVALERWARALRRGPASPGSRSDGPPAGDEVEDETPVVHRAQPGRVAGRREHAHRRFAQPAHLPGREPLHARRRRAAASTASTSGPPRRPRGARAGRRAPRGARRGGRARGPGGDGTGPPRRAGGCRARAGRGGRSARRGRRRSGTPPPSTRRWCAARTRPAPQSPWPTGSTVSSSAWPAGRAAGRARTAASGQRREPGQRCVDPERQAEQPQREGERGGPGEGRAAGAPPPGNVGAEAHQREQGPGGAGLASQEWRRGQRRGEAERAARRGGAARVRTEQRGRATTFTAPADQRDPVEGDATSGREARVTAALATAQTPSAASRSCGPAAGAIPRGEVGSGGGTGTCPAEARGEQDERRRPR